MENLSRDQKSHKVEIKLNPKSTGSRAWHANCDRNSNYFGQPEEKQISQVQKNKSQGDIRLHIQNNASEKIV